MSLFGNISMLGQAMKTFDEGLNVVSNNNANLMTTGYTQEVLDINSLPPVTMGTLQLGMGDEATNIQSTANIYLQNQIFLQLSDLGEAQARQTALQDLANIFPEIASPSATTGIQGAMNALSANWTALAAAPTSTAAETAVYNSLQTLAKDLNQDDQLVYNAQLNLNTQVVNDVNQVNTYLNQIASLNTQISQITAEGQGSNPNTLIDARQQAAQSLSQLIGANFRILGDGSMSVSISAGTLVNEGTAYDLVAIPSATNPGVSDIGYRVNSSDVYTDITGQISGGELAGLIQTRDVDAKNIRLALNQVAYGMIQATNLINQSAIATDGTTEIPIFTGTSAADIALNPVLQGNPQYIGSTQNLAAPGALATMEAAIPNFLTFSYVQSTPSQNVAGPGNPFIDPTIPIGSLPPGTFAINPGAPTAVNPGSFVINTPTSNGTPITWTTSDSINDIINEINSQSGGAYYATFDQTSKKMIIISDAPLTIYDISSTFTQAMQLSAIVTSSAPINNAALPTLVQNQVNGVSALNAQPNLLNLFTPVDPMPQAPATYQIKVNNTITNWLPTTTIGAVLNQIKSANLPATGNQISFNINAASQILSLIHVGDTVFNTGTLTAANPMTSISVSDVSGNLSQVFNFDPLGTPQGIFSQMANTLSSNISSETEHSLFQRPLHLLNSTAAIRTHSHPQLKKRSLLRPPLSSEPCPTKLQFAHLQVRSPMPPLQNC